MRPNRIIIADNDLQDLFLLRHIIFHLYPKCEICMFSDWNDALAHALVAGADLLIANQCRRRVSGFDMIRALRARGSTMPAIIVSPDPTVEQKALAAGATDFLCTNSDPKLLEARIRAVVEIVRSHPRSTVKPKWLASAISHKPRTRPAHRLRTP